MMMLHCKFNQTKQTMRCKNNNNIANANANHRNDGAGAYVLRRILQLSENEIDF